MTGYDDFVLGLQLGEGRQIWVSAVSRLGHVHGVTAVQPGVDVLSELFEHLYDMLDAVRFAQDFDEMAFSQALGDIAFGEPVVRELFQAARGAAADRGRQLIVRIQASPRLSALPWELLPDPSTPPSGAGFRHLTLAPDVHVVRLSRGRTYPIRSEPLEPPLNLLVVLSSPMGERPGDDTLTFDIYEAKRNLLGELMTLQDGGWLNIDVEDRPTMDNLRRRIGSKRRGYHLLHYLGHAEPDLLLLEDQRGRRRDVNGAHLVDWLRSCPDLRLVTFAGCETARPGGDPSLSSASSDWQQLLSLAERAAQGSSPVVLGMQAVLPFRTEWLLTRSLYQALASGNTIVDALRLAREAVRSDESRTPDRPRVPPGAAPVPEGAIRRPKLIDWAIPALFLNSAEPAPLLDRAGSPPTRPRSHSNVAKLDPPPAGAGLIGRDAALRQAVEVLSGRTQERVLLISGTGGIRSSELLDRALDEIDGDVSDILSVPYKGLNDEAEAGPYFVERDGKPSPPIIVRANMCAAISQLLERSDHRSRERNPTWTLPVWWRWLAEDLAGRRAVVAIDGLNALALTSGPLRTLARAWLGTTFPVGAPEDESDQRRELENLVEQLRDGAVNKQVTERPSLLEEYDAFVGGVPENQPIADDPVAREILAEEAEELLNQRSHREWGPVEGAAEGSAAGPAGGDAGGDLDPSREELRAIRAATEAVGDMLTRLVRRSRTCRVALVVDEIPPGLLRDIDHLVFPMRLGEITWPEMWRWIHRTLPGLAQFGQDRLQAVWRKYLGSEVERWEELERRVSGGAVAGGFTSPGDDVEGVESPESGLELLALQIATRRVPPRPTREAPSDPGSKRRRDRPLVVAAATLAQDGDSSDSPWKISFETFQALVNTLAERHGIGGRVTSTTVLQQDTLAVLVPVRSPFQPDGSATADDLARWYSEVGSNNPDIVLLDFGGPDPASLDKGRGNGPFPATARCRSQPEGTPAPAIRSTRPGTRRCWPSVPSTSRDRSVSSVPRTGLPENPTSSPWTTSTQTSTGWGRATRRRTWSSRPSSSGRSCRSGHPVACVVSCSRRRRLSNRGRESSGRSGSTSTRRSPPPGGNG